MLNGDGLPGHFGAVQYVTQTNIELIGWLYTCHTALVEIMASLTIMPFPANMPALCSIYIGERVITSKASISWKGQRSK